MAKPKVPNKLIPWLEAQKRHRLTDVQVQMARELGMNPKKLGKLDNHKQEPWKLPLPRFIESLYQKRFKRPRPEKVLALGSLAAGPAQPRVGQEPKKNVKHTPIGAESPAIERSANQPE
jgi:hypothetical protein